MEGTGEKSTSTPAEVIVPGWRRFLVLGVVLSCTLVLLALLLAWREQHLLHQQAVSRSYLVAEGIERQLRDRLKQLGQELQDYAAQVPATDAPLPAWHDSLIRRLSLAEHTESAAQLRAGPALVLLPPQEGSNFLQATWGDGTGTRVLVELDPEWFVQLLRERSLGSGSAISLVHDSRRIYVRAENNVGLTGKPFPELWIFRTANLSSRRGWFQGKSLVDEQTRFFVYQRVAGTPLTVLVSHPGDVISAPAWVFLFTSLLIAGVLVLMWLWLLRAHRAVNAEQDRLLEDLRGSAARLEQAQQVVAQDATRSEHDQKRFELISRATSDAVWDWDLASDSLWWSTSFYRTFGYHEAEIEPTISVWTGLVHPDDRERVLASLAEVDSDSAAEEWEQTYRFLHKDGHYVEVVDRGFLVRKADGRIGRMLGGMVDVGEQRAATSQLRLLSRAVEASGSGIAIADALAPDMPLVYVNPAFERITGYASSEVLGRNCRFLQGRDSEQLALEGVRHAIAEQSEAWVRLRNYRKDGTMFWNDFYVAPVVDDIGTVTHFLGIQNDVSEHYHYEQQLAYRASHDALTGLPNRQLLRDRLQMAVVAAESAGRRVAVVFIDIDDFKLVNDSLNHAAGDEALALIAQRLLEEIGPNDMVSRFGGDEFVILLPDFADDARVHRLIARTSRALSVPMFISGIEHVLTQSIGWCTYPECGNDAETLLKHADMAMYEAKRMGRNRSVQYSPQLKESVSRRLQLVGSLREALEKKQFVLAFQPIYDRDGRPRALECLARWQHPQRGLLPPSEFIPACEESGLIVELGRRTLHEAARHHALLAAAGLGHLRLAVNVSATQFAHALEQDVADVVRDFSLPHGVLELELTESVIMDNPDGVIQTMRRLAELGVCLSIDDFGAGYSSLAYLKRLPIHRLKIDRSFVKDLPDDRDAGSICSSIIALAHNLGLLTVGEGVETEQQRGWLVANGCDEIQGYLMARPASFDAILSLLSK